MGRLMPYRYSGENKRAENDQYLTPLKPVEVFCYHVNKIMGFPKDITVLDPCAGEGIWGATYRNKHGAKRLYGIDIDEALEMPYQYDGWQTGNFLTAKFANRKFDLIISNPPFNQAEKFIYHGASLLNEGGTMAYMLPLGFMSTIGRYNRLFRSVATAPSNIIISSRRIDFTGQGSPHTDVAMFVWSGYTPMEGTIVSWVDWEDNYAVQ